MALVLMEGFDLLTASYVLTKYPLTAAYSGNMQAGRFSPGQAYQPGPNNQNGAFVMQFGGVSALTLGVGMRLPIGGASTGNGLIQFETSAPATQFRVGVDSNGAVMVNVGTASLATPLAKSANGVIASNAWFYIETEFVLSDTVGECRVWVNGAKVIDISGVDTKGQTSAVVQQITLSMGGMGEGGIMFDDIYLTDTAARLGESRIYVLEPTSDNAVEWTPSTGVLNYAMVDEAPYDTTDYVASATVGHEDYYGFADLPYVPAAIHAVQTNFFARKDDAASRTVRANLNSGGTIASGTDFGLASTTLQKTDLFVTNPNGGGAWNAAAVNALLSGPEVRA